MFLAFPFKRKEVKQMKNFFDWFDKIEPNKKAEIVSQTIILITAIINLIIKLIG